KTCNRERPLWEERSAANTERIQAEQRLTRLQAHQREGGFNLPDDDVRVIQQRRLIEELPATYQRLERHERAAAAWQPAVRVLSNVETWIKDKPGGTALEDYDETEFQRHVAGCHRTSSAACSRTPGGAASH